MTAPRRPLIAGNWKMNGLKVSERELAGIVAGSGDLRQKIDLMICPPATLIMRFVAAAGGAVAIGGQDCHAEPSGAFTGDISAEMLADLGASAVIVGHSERRTLHHESDAEVRRKAEAARRAGLLALLCVCPTQAEPLHARPLTAAGGKLAGSFPDGGGAQNLVIAYAPVWAIATGLTPTPADV